MRKLLACIIITAFSFGALAESVDRCAQYGGKKENVKLVDKLVSFCFFDVNAAVEEGTLDRYMNGNPSEAIERFLNPNSFLNEAYFNHHLMLPNPFAPYCAKLDGKSFIAQVPNKGLIALCVFKDNSIIDGATLWRGANDPVNHLFVQVLKSRAF